ncbi:Thiol-disulfide oxidoreductase ResA [Rubripirellula tenax]|uniref:Thiol-disulfide oxidoreductase ResA n=2 Tax=Rubripirellula tenax TaxID=2528015 RepID=A0A5C6FEH6_9BACT|nr:Thiol-disulfide oxidoreductase ResA [Rubripirellula tenax]
MMDHLSLPVVMVRRFRLFTAAAGVCLGSAIGGNAVAATPSAASALGLKPVQDGVDFDVVSADVADRCTVTDIDRKGWSGWEVVSPDGMMLRRFADTNGDKKVDLWSYYKFGVEIYRDIDDDFNGKADQYRWLGTGGTRWGFDDDEDGKIDRWQQISAEEVSAELVAAVRDADPARFARLLIGERELKSLGLGPAKTEQLMAKADRAARDFAALAKRQTSVGPDARWVQFAASPPGVVPEGTDGSTKDVTVYENAVAMYEQDKQGGQMMVGTLIQSGDAWRLVELPSVGNEGEPIAQTTGNFFTPGGSGAANMAASGGIGEMTQKLVTALEAVDGKLSTATKPNEIADLHAQRADVIEELIANADSDAIRDSWVRQLVDTIGLAVQNGSYPDGMERLRKVAPRFAMKEESLASYADYTAISTEYVVRQTPEADFAEVQKWYLESLTGFVDRYPQTAETAAAYLQLALSKEFEDKEDEALEYYKKVAVAFPGTDAGEKAAGAARRLDSVGRRIELEGQTIQGKPFSLASLRGKPVVVHYWATWCEPCKQDMKLLRRLQASYQRAGLQLVGVNVDATADSAAAFLNETPLPWVQLFEPGGLESSRLAKTLGVQTLPTMMLIDPDGKVVRHNVRAAELDEELTAMLKRK